MPDTSTRGTRTQRAPVRRAATAIGLLLGLTLALTGCTDPGGSSSAAEVAAVDGGDGGLADKLAAPFRYEAESRTAQSGCAAASNHAGFTGSGFVDFGGQSTWIEWNNIDAALPGPHTLTLRFAHGGSSARPTAVRVNGATVGTLQLGPTGGWSSWKAASIVVSLRQGKNTIRVTATTTAGGPNVDHAELTSQGSAAPRGLYTWNFGGIEALDVSAAAGLLSRTGYAGIVVDTSAGTSRLNQYLTASKQSDDFRVVAAYVALQLHRGEAFSAARHKAAIDLLAAAGEGDLWFTFRDDNRTQTKQALTRLVNEIVSYAAIRKVRTVLYPHNNNVYPTTAAAMELVRAVNHVNFGVALNLTHELRAGNDDRDALEAAFEAAGDKLFAVTLAGASENLTAVRPLHDSAYDLVPFMTLIRESGFAGPVGFLNHTLTDPQTYLPLSLDAWQAQAETIGLRELDP